jgi:hypothetical protein
MKSIPVTVEQHFAGEAERVCLHIVPIDLTRIFTGYGPLPAVTGTSEATGSWNVAGQRRKVHLSDGSTARERLTAYDSPSYFSYIVSDFSGVLRFLADSAEGEWWFEPVAGGTQVRWRYAFTPASVLAKPVLFVVSRLWQGYMRKALRLAAAVLPAA